MFERRLLIFEESYKSFIEKMFSILKKRGFRRSAWGVSAGAQGRGVWKRGIWRSGSPGSCWL
jgi:hypothetical protein